MGRLRTTQPAPAQAYPHRRESRGRAEQILAEAEYYLRQLAAGSEAWAAGRPAEVRVEDLMGFSRETRFLG